MSGNTRIVIGVIGNDIHVVANRLLARGLRQEGYLVCNLGVSVLPEDFLYAAIEHEADVVIISSLNGEGEGWAQGFKQLFLNKQRSNILLYIGGNLAVGERSSDEVERRYRDLGFDRAYHRPSSLYALFTDLETDFNHVKH
jgi:methylaspartate mutase sigma subunit